MIIQSMFRYLENEFNLNITHKKQFWTLNMRSFYRNLTFLLLNLIHVS